MQAIVPLLALLAAAQGAHAQAPTPPLTEATFLGEVPIVLSATRLPQPLSESPASITVIDRQTIEASGALDLPDVLRLVPGFQVGHVGGVFTTVTYHGLADAYSRRLQVLIDGRSVYSAAFGGVLWTELPLAIEDIQRIEVIRGPNGAAYGANAFAAVVNIVTRHSAEDPGVFARLTAGDEKTRKAVVRYGGAADDLSYRLTLGYREDEGFPDDVDGKEVSMAIFRGDYRVNSLDTLDVQLGYNGGPRGDGAEGSLTDPAREERRANHFEHIRWRRTLAADEEWSLLFYHNYFRMSDTVRIPADAPLVTLSEDLLSERYDLELQRNTRVGANTRLAWGAEARLDRTRGPGWFGTNDLIDTSLYRVFANAEWRFAPDWLLNAGAMYEHCGTGGEHASPRLALNRHLSRHHTLRAAYSQAFRSPSLIEHQANAVLKLDDGTVVERLLLSDATLAPERIDSYEIGYIGAFPEHGLSLDLKIYREEIRDLIATPTDRTTVPGDPYDVFRSDGEVDTNGIELLVELRPAPRTQLRYAHAYAHQRGRILTGLAPPAYVSTAPSTPVHTRSFMAVQRFGRDFETSLIYYKVGNMKFFGGGDDTGDYDVLDVRLAYKLRSGGARGEIALIGQNLAGEYFDFDEKFVARKRYLINLTTELR